MEETAVISTVIFIFEIIGTIAFSISGAIVAIEKKMDILGVMILGFALWNEVTQSAS